jgi:hypothetical protein
MSKAYDVKVAADRLIEAARHTESDEQLVVIYRDALQRAIDAAKQQPAPAHAEAAYWAWHKTWGHSGNWSSQIDGFRAGWVAALTATRAPEMLEWVKKLANQQQSNEMYRSNEVYRAQSENADWIGAYDNIIAEARTLLGQRGDGNNAPK